MDPINPLSNPDHSLFDAHGNPMSKHAIKGSNHKNPEEKHSHQNTKSKDPKNNSIDSLNSQKPESSTNISVSRSKSLSKDNFAKNIPSNNILLSSKQAAFLYAHKLYKIGSKAAGQCFSFWKKAKRKTKKTIAPFFNEKS